MFGVSLYRSDWSLVRIHKGWGGPRNHALRGGGSKITIEDELSKLELEISERDF